jgi:hypothetical protein
VKQFKHQYIIGIMKPKQFVTGALAALGWCILPDNMPAQPVVSYTVSGTPGQYTLDFTVNNTTPGTSGWDIYYFGVLVDGVFSGSPPGYHPTYYSTIHRTEVTGPAYNWPYNNIWIDLTHTLLPTGANLSGFTASVTDLSAPASVQYFALGYNAGVPYTGPDNQNMSSPYNPPLFVGYAVAVIPEPAAFSMSMAAGLLLVVSRRSRV